MHGIEASPVLCGTSWNGIAIGIEKKYMVVGEGEGELGRGL